MINYVKDKWKLDGKVAETRLLNSGFRPSRLTAK